VLANRGFRLRRLFKPTSERLHRLNRLVRSPRLKYAAILAADLFHLRHLIVRFDPVNACNLRCGMCFFSDPQWRHAHMKGQFAESEIERLAGMFFGQALQVHIGCAMEPTMFRDYPRLVEIARRHQVPFVGFTTNGQRLTAQAFQRMAIAGLSEITISTHGVQRESYENLMKGASYSRHHDALKMIDEVRRKLGAKAPRLRLNYTVCPQNLAELDSFFDVYGGYGINTVQLRPIADFGDTNYRDKDLTPHLVRYNACIDRIAAASRSRGIALLANRLDPTHTRANAAASVYLEGILRYLNPNLVWRSDFSWRSDGYRAHKHRIGWRGHLLRRAILGIGKNLPPSHQAVYEVL
jgi:molybdenum cofactor biosynthesis enzyme MoaA